MAKTAAVEQTISVRTAAVRVRGVGPYSANAEVARAHPKTEHETNDQHEQRTWRYRLNVGPDGTAIIPGTAFTNALIAASRFLGLQIPGEGKATYAKLMEKSIMPAGDACLGVKPVDVEGEWLHVPSDGRRGGGKRVWKCFPKLDTWEAVFEVSVIGDKLTREVFAKIADAAGKFIGLGRFRPQNGGFYGRFEVVGIEWRDEL